MATSAPAPARARATAAPMPRDPPVTRATFPARSWCKAISSRVTASTLIREKWNVNSILEGQGAAAGVTELGLCAIGGCVTADLMATARAGRPVPTFAEYVPVVSVAVTPGTPRAYGSYRNRIIEHWGGRRMEEPIPSEVRELMTYVKTHVVARRNARGGRSAAEHLVATLRCLYQRAVDNGLISQADTPARTVAEPRRLPSTRRGRARCPAGGDQRGRRADSDDPELDTLLLRLHTEKPAAAAARWPHAGAPQAPRRPFRRRRPSAPAAAEVPVPGAAGVRIALRGRNPSTTVRSCARSGSWTARTAALVNVITRGVVREASASPARVAAGSASRGSEGRGRRATGPGYCGLAFASARPRAIRDRRRSE